jgi:IS5 family transposase
VVHRTPFTIRFPNNSPTHTQPLTQGVDAGSSVLRSAVIDEDGNLLHASEVMVRNDIADRMKRRPTYRRLRCQRKPRYRAPRFDYHNNSTRKDRFSPGEEDFMQGRFRTDYLILLGFDGEKVDLKLIPEFNQRKRLSARKSWIRAQTIIESICG